MFKFGTKEYILLFSCALAFGFHYYFIENHPFSVDFGEEESDMMLYDTISAVLKYITPMIFILIFLASFIIELRQKEAFSIKKYFFDPLLFALSITVLLVAPLIVFVVFMPMMPTLFVVFPLAHIVTNLAYKLLKSLETIFEKI